jgi:hypothetical protein
MLEKTREKEKNIFDSLLKKKDYPNLGWFLWNGFGDNIDDEMTNLHLELWNSLSDEEKKLCKERRNYARRRDD